MASTVTEITNIPIELRLVSGFPNTFGEISVLDLSLPLVISPNPYRNPYHDNNIVPKIWICNAGLYNNPPYQSNFLMVEKDKLLEKNLTINDFVMAGHAQEVTLEQIQEILKQAKLEGHLLVTHASLCDHRAQERSYLKIYDPK